MAKVELDALREKIARLERGSSPIAADRFSTGSGVIDDALGGGLLRGAMHEVFAESISHQAAATAFAIGLAVRASGNKPVVWVRQDFVGLEMGEIYAPGLAELGLSPERLILVKARDGPSTLKAGEEAAHCPPLGAVLVEPWGNPKTLDLVATRRLALAAARSNLPLIMVRAGGSPAASAAATRWNIRSALSRAFEADAPGHPSFTAELLRDRAGAAGRGWTVEWNRDHRSFIDISGIGISGNSAALPGHLVSTPAGGSDHAGDGRRRTG